MKFIADDDGPGSYKNICEYVEAVLRENFEMIPEKSHGYRDPYKQRARNITTSIFNRLGVYVRNENE